jgi:hypothetical protein
MMGAVAFCYQLRHRTILNSPQNNFVQVFELDSSKVFHEKIILLAVSQFRTSLVIVSCIVILAAEFDIFKMLNEELSFYGLFLVDVGIGYFIMCHSMKVFKEQDANDGFCDKKPFSNK